MEDCVGILNCLTWQWAVIERFTVSFFEEVPEMLVGPDILLPPGFENMGAFGAGADNNEAPDEDIEDSGYDSSEGELEVDYNGDQFLPPGIEPVCVIQ